MPGGAHIWSISLPKHMSQTVDRLAKLTDQSRSELVRHALREYVADMEGDRQRFVEAYQATRRQKIFTHAQLKKELGWS